jgi:hypothetical protein
MKISRWVRKLSEEPEADTDTLCNVKTERFKISVLLCCCLITFARQTGKLYSRNLDLNAVLTKPGPERTITTTTEKGKGEGGEEEEERSEKFDGVTWTAFVRLRINQCRVFVNTVINFRVT